MLMPVQLLYLSTAVWLLPVVVLSSSKSQISNLRSLHSPTIIDRKMVNRQMPVHTFSNHSACCKTAPAQQSAAKPLSEEHQAARKAQRCSYI
jgi:hypothetical protein